MAKTRRRWSEAERGAVLAAQAESGLSLWGFAREWGLPYTTLAHWKRRGSGSPPRLVPVELVPAEPDGRRGGVEVVVGDVVVRAGSDVDEALLARVVRALRAC